MSPVTRALVLTLVWLLAVVACDPVDGPPEQHDPGRSGEPAPRPAEWIPVVNRAGEEAMTRRQVVLDGDPATRRMSQAQLVVEGYTQPQLSEVGLPREGEQPTFRWVSHTRERSWPEAVEIELPLDSQSYLVAWLDLNDSLQLDTGDRCGRAHRPLEPVGQDPGAPVGLRIDRTYVAAATQAETLPVTTWRVRFEARQPQVEATREGSLLLLGYSSEDLDDRGLTGPDAEPKVEWRRPEGPLQWPVEAPIPLPHDPDLWLVPVLDLDLDGRLGPGDWFSVPAGPFDPPIDISEAVPVGLERQLPAARPRGGG